jgi:hypothetical protein
LRENRRDENYENSPSMELQIGMILLSIMLGLASDACWK